MKETPEIIQREIDSRERLLAALRHYQNEAILNADTHGEQTLGAAIWTISVQVEKLQRELVEPSLL